MDERVNTVQSALSVLLSGSTASPLQLNAANATLVAFRAQPDAFAVCADLMSSERAAGNALLLHFAVGTLCDLLETQLGSGARLLILLKKAASVCGRLPHPALALAVQRLLGKAGALLICGEWKTCVADCLSLPQTCLALGALQQLVEFVEKLLVGKAASQAVARMQDGAAAVCGAIVAQPLTRESLRLLEAWLRVGAVPVAVLVPSGLVEKTVAALGNAALSENAISVLGELFSAPVAVFRTARSVARTSLALDVPAQRVLVMAVLQELLRASAAQMSEPLVALVCDILRQHPSIILTQADKRQQLLDYLIACLSVSPFKSSVAGSTLPVWICLEEALAGGGSKGVPAAWRAVFGKVLMLVLQSVSVTNVEYEAMQEWRLQLEDVVLSCAQTVGLECFYDTLAKAPLETALWAATCDRVLHDGRTPYCLPHLVKSLLELPQPLSSSLLAQSACGFISGHRTFVRQNAGEKIVLPLAQFCSKCLQVAPAAAARALLDLSEVCGTQLASDLHSIAPFALRALPRLDGDTAVTLMSTCAELAANLEEARAAPVCAEIVETLLKGATSIEEDGDFAAVCGNACIAFCDRSVGRCGAVYAQWLERAWPRLSVLIKTSDEMCDLVTALAIAACDAGRELLPLIAAAMSEVFIARQSQSAVLFLKSFVVLNSSSDRLVAAFVTAFGKCCQMPPQTTADTCIALFDVAKRAQWNPVWQSALASTAVTQWALACIPQCYERFGSNFKLAGEMAAFEESLFEHSGELLGSNAALQSLVVALTSMHASLCLTGNPLAMRFHSGPLWDCVRLLPPETAFSCLASSFGRVLSESRLAQAAAHKAMQQRDSHGGFRGVIVDLQLLATGRGDPEFLYT